MPVTQTSFPPSPCTINIHKFSSLISERLIHYQVTQLRGQTMIWVGEGDPVLSSLAAGVPGPDCPSTSLFGGGDQSTMLAGRLAKKLNKQVFVSYNVADDLLTTPQVIERLVEEIKKFPEKF